MRHLLATAALLVALPAGAEELNALVWCDHADPALIEPFEKEHGVTVNLKEYEGTGAGLAIIEQSQPGDWDVLVIDGIDVPRAIDAGILGPMPAEALPLSDLFPELRLAEYQERDGQIYAVTEKFGYNTISFNSAKVDPKDMESIDVMFSDKYKDRIAIYDYYTPVIGLVALSLGLDPGKLSDADVPAIREKLFAMKAVSAQIGEAVASQTALATGEVDILVGGGEWVTAGLSAEKPELDWVIPAEGAVRWSQSIGVFKDAKNPELALKFVQYILSPEGQARLATSSCYWAMPANVKAGAVLTPEQKRALRWDDQPAYLARAKLYPAPSPELDALLQDAWTEMLQR